MNIVEMTWPEIQRAARNKNAVAVLPIAVIVLFSGLVFSVNITQVHIMPSPSCRSDNGRNPASHRAIARVQCFLYR
jgi:hypothetical protein